MKQFYIAENFHTKGEKNNKAWMKKNDTTRTFWKTAKNKSVIDDADNNQNREPKQILNRNIGETDELEIRSRRKEMKNIEHIWKYFISVLLD